MNIAILGATSLIAQDLVRQWKIKNKKNNIFLYARNIDKVRSFLSEINELACVKHISCFPENINHDVILNFIGAGDPQKISDISDSIITLTNHYDDLVLKYLHYHPECKYIYLSSGAVYGNNFSSSGNIDKSAEFDINNIKKSDFYGISKFIAEAKHREASKFAIVDVRVFNYFSRHHKLKNRFFITDLIRAIKSEEICNIDPLPMVRDYLNPIDFCQIINRIIAYDKINESVDCYTRSPISKSELINLFEKEFGLKWRYTTSKNYVNATNDKEFYYSENNKLENMGYKPIYSSAESILIEASELISGKIHDAN